MRCEYCNHPLIECMAMFEVSALLDTHLEVTHVDDKSFSNINDGIEWAKSKGADLIDVYQGCNRENLILTLRI